MFNLLQHLWTCLIFLLTRLFLKHTVESYLHTPAVHCMGWVSATTLEWSTDRHHTQPGGTSYPTKIALFFQYPLLSHPTQKKNHIQTYIGWLKGTTSNSVHFWPKGVGKSQEMLHGNCWERGTKMKSVGMGRMEHGWGRNYVGWWLLGKPSTWTWSSKNTQFKKHTACTRTHTHWILKTYLRYRQIGLFTDINSHNETVLDFMTIKKLRLRIIKTLPLS